MYTHWTEWTQCGLGCNTLEENTIISGPNIHRHGDVLKLSRHIIQSRKLVHQIATHHMMWTARLLTFNVCDISIELLQISSEITDMWVWWQLVMVIDKERASALSLKGGNTSTLCNKKSRTLSLSKRSTKIRHVFMMVSISHELSNATVIDTLSVLRPKPLVYREMFVLNWDVHSDQSWSTTDHDWSDIVITRCLLEYYKQCVNMIACVQVRFVLVWAVQSFGSTRDRFCVYLNVLSNVLIWLLAFK
jgi:hypothetical protein